MSEKYCLKWDDFETNVSKSFGLLRNEDYLHDVTLVCDDNKQVSAHKLVLSACSEYFKSIFRNNNHPNPLICLEGVSSPELRNILDYMYNGETNIFQENLDNFLSLAQRLKILGLPQNDKRNSPDNTAEEVTKTEQEEECAEEYNDKTINNKMNAIKDENSGFIKNRNTKNIDNADSCIINGYGYQHEIDREVDKHIEISNDGNMKCTFCGKVDNANGKSKPSTRKTNMRCHVETHLDGISYQCQFCEVTFKSRSSYSNHKTRFHK